MKPVFQLCGADSVLARVSDNFRAVQRIIEDSKRFRWNKNLPNGYHLVQDFESRFGTVLLVTERFLKSALNVWTIIRAQNRSVSRNAYESLEKDSHSVSGRVLNFPALKSIVDGFKPVYDMLLEAHKTHEPTMRKIVPSLQFCIRKLKRVENGGRFFVLRMLRFDCRYFRCDYVV